MSTSKVAGWVYDRGERSKVSQELAGLRRLLMNRLKAEGTVRVWDPVRNTPTIVSFKARGEVRPLFCPSADLVAQLDEDHGEFGDAALGILVREPVNGHVDEYWCEITVVSVIQDAALLRMLTWVPDG